MVSRPFLSLSRRQRFWEFFIFGCVFVALLLFWLLIRADLIIGYITGVLAGLCFTAAWFHRGERVQVMDEERVRQRRVEPVTQAEPLAPAVEEREVVPQGRIEEKVEPPIVEKEPESVPESKVEPQEVQESAPVPVAQKEPVAEPQAQAEPAVEVQQEPVVEAQAQAEPVSEVQQEPQVQAEPVPVAQNELAAEPQAEPVEGTTQVEPVQEREQQSAHAELAEPIQAEAAAATLPPVVLSQLDLEKGPQIDAYCVKCHQRRPMVNPRLVEMKNDRSALRSTCPVCGSGLFRIISEQQESQWSHPE